MTDIEKQVEEIAKLKIEAIKSIILCAVLDGYKAGVEAGRKL